MDRERTWREGEKKRVRWKSACVSCCVVLCCVVCVCVCVCRGGG